MNPTSILIGEQRIALLESRRPPLPRVTESLLSPDPAESIAAAQSVARRYEKRLTIQTTLPKPFPTTAFFRFHMIRKSPSLPFFLAALLQEQPDIVVGSNLPDHGVTGK